MGKNITGYGVQAYLGVQAPTPPNLTYELRDPVAADNGGYIIGHIWVTKSPIAIFMLTSKAPYTATWTKLYPVAGAGTVTSVNPGTNINITFLTNPAVDPVVNLNNNVTLTGFLQANTVIADNGLTVTLGGATINGGGLTVVLGGIDSIGQTRLQDLTNGVVLSGATGILSTSTPGVAGTVLMSNGAALAPTWQALGGGGTVLVVTGDANITIANNPNINPQVTLNPSVSLAGNLTAGTGLIATTGGLTVNSGGITSTGTTTLNSLNHVGVMMTDVAGVVSSMVPGADNEVLTSLAGAISWLPVPGITYPISIANGGTNAIAMANNFGVNYFDGTRIVTTAVGSAGQVLKSQGAGLPPIWDTAGGTGTVTNLVAGTNISITGATPTINPTVNVTNDVTLSGFLHADSITSTNAFVVTNGPTTLSYLNHVGAMLTNGSGVVSSLAPGGGTLVLTSTAGVISWAAAGGGTVTNVTATAPIFSTGGATPNITFHAEANGKILVANTTTSPAWVSLTAGNGILITPGVLGAETITIAARANFPCDTGTATPNATGVLNVLGGAAIKTTGSGNTITIDDTLTINAQTGVSYTLVLTDAGKFITRSNALANTVTIPPNGTVNFVVGTQIVIQQIGAGQTSIVAGVGVTINSPGGRLKCAEQYSTVALVQTVANIWSLMGDLTA